MTQVKVKTGAKVRNNALVKADLKDKIITKGALICVIGLGYVGLPLATEFAKAGFSVTGIDDNIEKVKKVNKCENYILKDDDLTKIVREKKLTATCDYSVIKNSDIIIICVPTPLTKHRQPDTFYVETVSEEVSKYLKTGQLVVLESTTYPGTTEEILLPLFEKTGLKIGVDYFLAFSPERVDPGNKYYKTANTAKIIGGVTLKCREYTRILYEQVIEEVHVASSPKTAEMVKLLENIFRCVNIALVNELAILCKKMGINIWEVVDLASTKPYGFMPFYPGPGLGGHCIPIDPFYLTWKAKEFDFQTKFIELAGEINLQMPYYVVNLIIDALASQRKTLKDSKIFLLGIAYKKDIDDPRESPALKIMEILQSKGAKVYYNDRYIPEVKHNGAVYKSRTLDNLGEYDCVVVTAEHSYYKFDEIARKAKLIVDTRGVVKNHSTKVHSL